MQVSQVFLATSNMAKLTSTLEEEGVFFFVVVVVVVFFFSNLWSLSQNRFLGLKFSCCTYECPLEDLFLWGKNNPLYPEE